MVFYVTVVTSLMTLLMNKVTNTITLNFYFIYFWYILHPNIHVMKYCHG